MHPSTATSEPYYHYFYEGHRYENLADAISYATVVRARRALSGDPPSVARVEESPNESDRDLMTEFGISFVAGRFEFAGFKYERLLDAANYARHLRDSQPTDSPSRALD